MPLTWTYGASTAPPRTASRNSAGSSPSALVMASDSAIPWVIVATNALQASLSRLPAPASPTQSVRAPMASATADTRTSSERSPDARTVSVPSSAGFLVPRTGAST